MSKQSIIFTLCALSLLLVACAPQDARIEQFLKIYPDAQKTSENYDASDLAFTQEFFSRECDKNPPYARITYQQYGAKLILYEQNNEYVCALTKIEPGVLSIREGDLTNAPEGVALTVNGEPISFSSVQAAYATLPQEQQTIENLNTILNQLISQELLRQEASSYNVDSKKAYDEFLANANVSEEEFLAQIASQNITKEQVLSQLENQLKLDSLLLDKLGTFDVDDKETEQFYLENTNSFILSEQVTFQQVFIAQNERTTEQMRLRLDTVIRSLNSTDFCTAVKTYSDDKESIERCGIYTIPRGVVQQNLEQAVFSAPVGQVVAVQSETGVHVINILEKTPTTVVEYDQIQDQVKQFLQGQVQQLRLNAYIGSLRQGADVVTYMITQ